jgi:hypothetical protein
MIPSEIAALADALAEAEGRPRTDADITKAWSVAGFLQQQNYRIQEIAK